MMRQPEFGRRILLVLPNTLEFAASNNFYDAAEIATVKRTASEPINEEPSRTLAWYFPVLSNCAGLSASNKWEARIIKCDSTWLSSCWPIEPAVLNLKVRATIAQPSTTD